LFLRDIRVVGRLYGGRGRGNPKGDEMLAWALVPGRESVPSRPTARPRVTDRVVLGSCHTGSH